MSSRFLRNVILTLNTEIGVSLFSFFTTVYIVRVISPHQFGIYTLLTSFALTIYYLTSAGIPQAIIYRMNKPGGSPPSVVWTGAWLALLIGLIVALLLYTAREFFLVSFLKDLPARYFPLILALYVLTMMDAVTLAAARGLKRFHLFNLRRLLTPVLNLTAIVVAFLFVPPTLHLIVVIYTAVSVVLTTAFLIRTLAIFPFRPVPQRAVAGALLSYGGKSYLQIIAGHLIYQVDIYILAYFISAPAVAHYRIAVALATLLWFVPNTIGVVLFPELASTTDEDEIHRRTALVCRHTVWCTGGMAVILAVSGALLIRLLYGDEYSVSYPALLILLPGVLIMGVYKVLTRNFASRNRQHISLGVAVGALLLNLLLNFLLIPRFGLIGAAIASALAYTLAGALLTLKLQRESGLPISELLFVKPADIRGLRREIAGRFRISTQGKGGQ